MTWNRGKNKEVRYKQRLSSVTHAVTTISRSPCFMHISVLKLMKSVHFIDFFLLFSAFLLSTVQGIAVATFMGLIAGWNNKASILKILTWSTRDKEYRRPCSCKYFYWIHHVMNPLIQLITTIALPLAIISLFAQQLATLVHCFTEQTCSIDKRNKTYYVLPSWE